VLGSKVMGTFPFGWIRDIRDENWQLLWDSSTGTLYVKGAKTQKRYDLGQAPEWLAAKGLAGKFIDEPGLFKEMINYKGN